MAYGSAALRDGFGDRRGQALAALAGVAYLVVFLGLVAGSAAAQEDVWSELRGDLFGDRPIHDGGAWLTIEAPYRAYDAALVPVDIRVLRPQSPDRFIKTITLVIDQNPAPVAAVFTFGPLSGLASISTRVRVNAYSYLRAIAETNDGQLYMASRFVKASGGCSAPALKDQDQAFANLGQMRLRQFTPKPSAGMIGESPVVREAQLMIRHPNYSGLQMDQITRNYVPLHIVRDIEIRQGEDLVLAVEGAISLSENPSVRFHFVPNGAGALSVRIEDTEDRVFMRSWDIPEFAAPDS